MSFASSLKTALAAGRLAAAAFAFDAVSASAATVTAFNGISDGSLDLSTLADHTGGTDASGAFRFTPVSLTSGAGDGACDSAVGAKCLKFDKDFTTTMTTNPSGGTFDLVSLSFVLDGKPSVLGVLNWSLGEPGELIVTVGAKGNANDFKVDHNNWYTLDFEGAANGVTSILFDNLGNGNLRIGNIVATADVAAIPLPAGGLLLLGALGGLGIVTRRRKRAA